MGRINPATGDIIITGRAKDTIVLSNGENVEPQPIEDSITGTSALVDQAMIVGQDQNFLSAFLVVNPAELAKRGKEFYFRRSILSSVQDYIKNILFCLALLIYRI